MIRLLFLFTFLSLLLIECNFNKNKDNLLIEDVITQNYLCEQFEINSSNYKKDNVINYKVRLIAFNNIAVNEKLIEKNINKWFKDVNFNFKIFDIFHNKLMNPLMSCFDFLDGYYNNRYITICAIPDEYRFYEEKKIFFYGKANGIPSIKNTTKGKPVLFIRESQLYTKILMHELGHVFGLPHTFEGEDMLDRGFNCVAGDKIPDTLSPPDGLGVGKKTCEVYAPEGWENNYTMEELENAIQDPMSYSPPHCMGNFSRGQIQEMRKMASVNPRLQDAEFYL